VVEGVSVVVPTFQRAASLQRVLEPLLADPATTELIVVVDGSNDGTMELLEELARGDVRLRAVWQPNSGSGAARQRGVDEARCEVVLLLDDDVVARPGLVSQHAAAHQRSQGRVVVGSMPTPPITRRRRDDVTTVLYAKAYDHATREFVARPESVLEGFWSGNVSLPTELARHIGLGDPELADLFPSEDRELGLRMRAAGVEAVYCPQLAALHLHRRSLDRFVVDSRRQGRAMHVLAARHPDIVARLTGPQLAGRLPPPVRWLVTGARRNAAVGAAGEALTRALVQVTGALRWWRAQDVAIVLLQRVAQAQGAREGEPRD
jgi:GT2 family glycosyltransferase